jgi:hypothetical protein
MTRDECNKLFHKVGLNRVAFKAVNDCDDEILTLVNAVIAREREACAALADKWHDYCAWEGRVVGLNIAKDIRARGKNA